MLDCWGNIMKGGESSGTMIIIQFETALLFPYIRSCLTLAFPCVIAIYTTLFGQRVALKCNSHVDVHYVDQKLATQGTEDGMECFSCAGSYSHLWCATGM